MRRSHFRTHIKEQARKNIFITIVLVGGLIFLLFTFGPQLLINFSVGLEKLKGHQEVTQSEVDGFVAPPVLNDMPEATNSAHLIISGYTTGKQTVTLYINGEVVDEMTSDEDNNFTFRDVTVQSGENTIKARAKDKDGKESNYSNQLTVTYEDKAPSLTVDSPQDGQSVSKDNQQVRVSGKTDSGVRVVVNGFWAIVQDDGQFSYNLSIHDGDNDIKVDAIDGAGNITTKQLKIKRE